MTRREPNASTWKRICIIVAVIYAIPVAFALWSNFPTGEQVNADTARNELAALQQNDDKYKNMTPETVRRRFFRGLSNEQVTARIREIATAEEHRANALSARVTLGGEQAVVGFSQPLSAPDQQLRGVAELAQSAARPQVTVTMEEIDRQHSARMASLRGQQIKAILWAV